MKRILIYSHDTYGLGNIRRMLAIAGFLSERHRDISILLLTGSPMVHAFRIPHNVDYIKLPCLQRSVTGEYSARLEAFETDALVALRSGVIKLAVENFKPDLFLVDKKPEGLSGELRTTLQSLEVMENPPRMMLLLRDILDAPDVTTDIWQKHDYYSSIERHYDEVAVVGQKSVFDVTKEYSFPATIAAKTTFCGYLNRPKSSRDKAQTRGKLGLSNQRLVVVTVGGGADGKHVLMRYLEGIRIRPLEQDGRSILFSGPEMSATDRFALHQLAAECENVTLKEFSDDLPAYLDAADLVVAMGGYNTVCEILSLDKRAIIVPRTTPVLEQKIRAERLANLGLVDVITPENLTADALSALVRRNLQSVPKPDGKMVLDMNGMERLEERIIAQISARRFGNAKSVA